MAAADQLRIGVRREDGRVFFALDGELDMASAPLLQSALESAELEPDDMVVLDLAQLQFIDSTGLRGLLAAREYASERGHEFAVTPGTQQVQRLLSVTGVAEHLRTLAS